jgi:hypothetical protein
MLIFFLFFEEKNSSPITTKKDVWEWMPWQGYTRCCHASPAKICAFLLHPPVLAPPLLQPGG